MDKKLLSTVPFFLRTYIVVVFIILLTGWFLDKYLEHQHDVKNEASTIHHLTGSFLFINTLLNTNQPIDPDILSTQATQLLRLPTTLINKQDFSSTTSLEDKLNEGVIIALHNNAGYKTYYQSTKATPYIIAIGPLADSNDNEAETWVIALFYFILASAILAWAWPLVRNLNLLISSANKFGTDDFTTRIDLPRTSSIFPVAQTFNQMAERIQFLISSQRELSNAVSHELRTPLARMKFSLEMLANTVQSPQELDYIRTMRDDIDEVDELIEEMLNYAKLESDNLRLNIETVDILTWLQQQQLNWQRHSPALSINISPIASTNHSADTTNYVMIEPHLMSRAISNLIRNAQRYADGQVIITVETNSQNCRICVGDNGPGIPEGDREKVFSAFTRLDSSRARATGGYGLGLAIVKRILSRHGGDISIGTSSLGGAEFILEWPKVMSADQPNSSR